MIVVAGALCGPDGRWLMHRRPHEKHHGGLWEFPGGKVERAEFPAKALCRELQEELGIAIKPAACSPISFAEGALESGSGALVILLYKVEQWDGEPASRENGLARWFSPEDIKSLDKPPLDDVLANALFGY